jgi:hypothetical protein
VRAGGLSKRPVEVDVGHDALALTGVALCAIDPSAFRFARFALALAGHSHLVGGNDVVAEADEHTDQSGGPATTPQDPAFAVSRTVPGLHTTQPVRPNRAGAGRVGRVRLQVVGVAAEQVPRPAATVRP